jgi:hypothetical protein
MSAGFKVAGDLFWGTNGAVEAYLETMAALAESRLGSDDPLAAYLAEQRDSFSSGRVLFLDEWLADAASRGRFLELLDATTEQLLREGAFSEYGREWVASVVAALGARIAAGSLAEPGAADVTMNVKSRLADGGTVGRC